MFKFFQVKILQILSSRVGGWVTPPIATGIGAGIAWVSGHLPFLAHQLSAVDQVALTGFIATGIVSFVNAAINGYQRAGIKGIQEIYNAHPSVESGDEIPVDGLAGPITKRAVANLATIVSRGKKS